MERARGTDCRGAETGFWIGHRTSFWKDALRKGERTGGDRATGWCVERGESPGRLGKPQRQGKASTRPGALVHHPLGASAASAACTAAARPTRESRVGSGICTRHTHTLTAHMHTQGIYAHEHHMHRHTAHTQTHVHTHTPNRSPGSHCSRLPLTGSEIRCFRPLDPSSVTSPKQWAGHQVRRDRPGTKGLHPVRTRQAHSARRAAQTCPPSLPVQTACSTSTGHFLSPTIT